MPTGSYANLGGSCFQEINTTKSDKRPKELNERFLKVTGMSFHIFVPILENEFTWIESLELCV